MNFRLAALVAKGWRRSAVSEVVVVASTTSEPGAYPVDGWERVDALAGGLYVSELPDGLWTFDGDAVEQPTALWGTAVEAMEAADVAAWQATAFR